jgi:hypothetical protein
MALLFLTASALGEPTSARLLVYSNIVSDTIADPVAKFFPEG